MKLSIFFIQISQLDILGFHEMYRQYTVAFLMVVIGYIIGRPIITKLVKRNFFILLTYLFVSLVTSVITLTIALINPTLNSITIGLQAIILFGLCLIVFLIYRMLKEWIKQKWARRSSHL